MGRLIRVMAISTALLGIFSIGCNAQEMSGFEFLQRSLRLFQEVPGIQSKWISLNDKYVGIESVPEKVDWQKLDSEALELLGKFVIFYLHYGEDIDKIKRDLNQNDREKLDPFMTQAAIYVDVFNRTARKLCVLVNKLCLLTLDPESWTLKEHMKEVDAHYKALCEEYDVEGAKLSLESEKTRQIKIRVKSVE